jgi:hypothetical protein
VEADGADLLVSADLCTDSVLETELFETDGDCLLESFVLCTTDELLLDLPSRLPTDLLLELLL